MQSLNLDLHGCTWQEALEEFITVYNAALDSMDDANSVSLTVIHGHGSTGEGGIIRARLRAFLQRFSDHLDFTLGENLDGNRGCTIVAPLSRIPETVDLLAEQIWDYCAYAKSKGKVVSKFRRHGEPRILQAIKSLENQGRLHRCRRKKVGEYLAS